MRRRGAKGGGNNSLLRPEILKKLLMYGITVLFLVVMQCAFFPTVKLCPATPDLILPMLLAIAFFDRGGEKRASAAVCAVGSGVFVDALGGSGISLSPLVYLLFVLTVCALSEKVMSGLLSFLLLLLPTLAFRMAVTFVTVLVSERSFPPVWMLGDLLLPEAIMTALFAIPVYYTVKLASLPLRSSGRGKFSF